MISTILSNKTNGSNTMRGLFKNFEYQFNMISQIWFNSGRFKFPCHYKTIIYIQYFSTFNRYQSNFYFLILFLINSVLMIGFCINPFLSPLTFSYSRWSLLNSLAGRSATGGMPPAGVSKSSASSANSLRYSSIIENTHVQTVM